MKEIELKSDEINSEEKTSLFRTIFGRWYLYILGAFLAILSFVLIITISGYYLYKNPSKLDVIKNDLVSTK